MRRRPWLAALVVVAAACSSRPRVEAPGFVNGTRLAARFDDLDGTRLLVAFYDKTRDEECAFQLLPDGSAACLPKSGLLDGWFADAACSDPLVDVPSELPGRTPARALVTGAANACSDAPTVQTLGDVFPPTEAYYVKSDGTCVQNPPNATITLRRIGDAVPLDQFMHATPEVDAVSPSVGAVVLAASDGARFTLFGNDAASGEWTHSVDDGAGTSRWWPVHIAYNYGAGAPGTPGPVYADAACTVPTGIKVADSALCPITTVFEFISSTDPCRAYTFRLHHAGAPVAVSDLHAFDGSGACVANPPIPPDQLYVEMGDALPDDAFPLATVVDVGSGRVVQRFDGSPDGVAITTRRELHDNARNIDCSVRLAADGQRRCLPPAADAIYYADDNCTTAMVVGPEATSCAPDAAPPLEMAYQTHAYSVGALLSPTMVYEQSDSGCTLVGPPFTGSSFFALGPEIPPSAYQPATLRTE